MIASPHPAASSESRSGVAPGALVLVTGASGYVGGRLVTVLLERGYRVRCLVRTPAKVHSAPWRESVEIVEGDVGDDLTGVMEGVCAAFYLVHSIGSSVEWAEHDRAVAENFRRCAEVAGLQRIIYLGGLGDHSSGDLSEHLASRQEVGAELAKGAVPVVELRAAVVIGSGSASFEMLRYLVEVLPAMVTPRWVDTKCQPVAVRDVLHFLAESLTANVTGQVLDVGGPEVMTYRSMMAQYAEVAGLPRRVVIPVPFLTPGLSSRWIGLVTPIPPMLARPLIESLVNDVIVGANAAVDVMPIKQLSYREAVELALGRSIRGDVPTSWSHAELGGRPPAEPQPTDPAWSGGTVNLDRREQRVASSPAEAFQVVCSIGGRQGWYVGDWLWGLRGVFDSLVGGVGMRRGRLHPHRLCVGDPLDFWRVESLVPDRLLRLRAEMRLPGEAWLEWQIEPAATGATGTAGTTGATIIQTARFHPRGLLGRLYWIAVAPFHRFIFPGLLTSISADAERLHAFVNAPATGDRSIFRLATFRTRQLTREPPMNDTSAPQSNAAASASSLAIGATPERFAGLRRWNLGLSVLHAAQAILILLIAGDFAITVTSTFPEGPPGTRLPTPEGLFDVPIGVAIAVFLLLAAFDHLATATFARRTYESDLARGINRFRWVEYSISATLMVLLIAFYSGITDITAVFAIAGANVAMILFGWLQERMNPPGRTSTTMMPFWFGTVAGIAPWAAIWANVIGAPEIPGFVYGIVVAELIFFFSFGLNQWLQYRGVGRWRNYIYGEKVYLVLSLAAKSLLAWQIYGGSLDS